jgi:hypothetical protein
VFDAETNNEAVTVVLNFSGHLFIVISYLAAVTEIQAVLLPLSLHNSSFSCTIPLGQADAVKRDESGFQFRYPENSLWFPDNMGFRSVKCLFEALLLTLTDISTFSFGSGDIYLRPITDDGPRISIRLDGKTFSFQIFFCLSSLFLLFCW